MAKTKRGRVLSLRAIGLCYPSLQAPAKEPHHTDDPEFSHGGDVNAGTCTRTCAWAYIYKDVCMDLSVNMRLTLLHICM